MMARRVGTSHKCVEEKRRQLPIYQHYTLSPGKTKSHHPEARCIHCHKEFVCGSKQRLIRHIRKCNSITNPEQIIAETLNTLARNSATGQLNHSILEASNLLPSQISQIQHSATQQLVGQAIHQNSPSNSSTVTTATNSSTIINSNNNGHNSSGSNPGSGDQTPVATSSNSSLPAYTKRTPKRGRKPGSQNSSGPGIHVTTGVDGKTHFLPASQLTQVAAQGSPQIITQVHNGRGGQLSYAYQAAVATTTTPASNITATGAHLNVPTAGHLPCATTTQHTSPFKLNSELIDKAYLKLVLTRNLPLSLCDTKEFQAWLKTFANDYKPPSSINLIAQNLKNEAQSAKYRVNNILAKAPKKTINLELHSWTDGIRGHSWYAMIAGVDHKRFLISVRNLLAQLDQRALNHSESASIDKLFNEFINDNIKRVGSDRVNNLILTGGNDDDFIVEHARRLLYTNHPSIVTYHCWWYFTNLLCSDIFGIESFRAVLRNSNMLINFINSRSRVNADLEKFGPFAGASGSLYQKSDSNRWYSHLVCYLFQYLKNNSESIKRNLEKYSLSNFSFNNNDNNNNNSSGTSESDAQQNANASTQQITQGSVCRDSSLDVIKSFVMSTEYWDSLDSALVHLKYFQEIVALSPTAIPTSSNGHSPTLSQTTPVISSTLCSPLSLSEYMNWFLKYGKSLIDSWRRSPDAYTLRLIERFLARFLDSIKEFKLLFAAYLLNPKHRCAYMTQRAKDSAIEEILNIASEFMPEESDGHTIFDQWKLYLVREEPYDMSFDETRSSPLDWWMSLPCAESIRRVALRILRLRAFSSPKPENLFAPLYFYEDEVKTSLSASSFEDMATLRYFYDHEDKISQANHQNSLHSHNGLSTIHAGNQYMSNGFTDRTHVGVVHTMHQADSQDSVEFMPIEALRNQDSNGQIGDSNKFKEATVVDSLTIREHQTNIDQLDNTNGGDLETSSSYKTFCTYVDFNDLGIQIVTEEPIEKKRRKWTAQEILSKCQSNHHGTSSYNNNHEIQQK